MNPLIIDGSFGEGGGSILRLSTGFSVLKQIPILVKNIRANRSKPGLRMQHLRGLQALERLTGGKLSESRVGTTKIEFTPGKEFIENLTINVETAGNIALLLQPIQIACMKLEPGKRITLEIKGGGTYGKWAPGIVFLENVLYKIYEMAGYKIQLIVNKHGFYPKGGASLKCIIHSPNQPIKPINLVEMGEIHQINGHVICSEDLSKPRVAERIINMIKTQLSQKLALKCNIKFDYVKTYSVGVGLCLWAESNTNAIISSGTILGERGVSSEEVGRIAAHKLIKYIKNKIPVDNYLADQLIPIMSMIEKRSQIRVAEITSHLKTNLELLKLFNIGEYKISKENNGILVIVEKNKISNIEN